MGLALRFFHYALFDGVLLSAHYFITDTLVLIAGALLGYRLTRVRQMVSQYPGSMRDQAIVLAQPGGRLKLGKVFKALPNRMPLG